MLQLICILYYLNLYTLNNRVVCSFTCNLCMLRIFVIKLEIATVNRSSKILQSDLASYRGEYYLFFLGGDWFRFRLDTTMKVLLRKRI